MQWCRWWVNECWYRRVCCMILLLMSDCNYFHVHIHMAHRDLITTTDWSDSIIYIRFAILLHNISENKKKRFNMHRNEKQQSVELEWYVWQWVKIESLQQMVCGVVVCVIICVMCHCLHLTIFSHLNTLCTVPWRIEDWVDLSMQPVPRLSW